MSCVFWSHGDKEDPTMCLSYLIPAPDMSLSVSLVPFLHLVGISTFGAEIIRP